MRLKIRHVTRYAFDPPAQFGLHQVRMTARADRRQRVPEWALTLEGGTLQAEFTDQFANKVSLISVEPGAQALSIAAEGVVETEDSAGVYGAHEGPAPLWLFRRTTPLTEPGPRVRALTERLSPGGGAIERLHALSAHILSVVRYDLGHTDAATTAEGALAAAHGVCQDHTHIFIAAARLIGFPARYVSGYLMMQDREEQDAGHAWAEAYAEGLGWVGFDVSNGISPDARYIRVATGLDYADAAPVRGLTRGAGEQGLHVAVQVQQQQQ